LSIDTRDSFHDFIDGSLALISLSRQLVCLINEDSVSEDELSQEELVLRVVRVPRRDITHVLLCLVILATCRVELCRELLRIDQTDAAVQLNFALQAIIKPESLHDLARVGQSVRLDQNEFELGLSRFDVVLEEGVKCLNEVVFGRAANASIGHLVEVVDIFPVRVLHEGALQSHLWRELILNNSHALVQLRCFQDLINQSRLA